MNRIELKEKAKKIFLSRYWLLVGIFAIIMAITGAVAGLYSGGSSMSSSFTRTLGDSGFSPEVTIAFILMLAIALVCCGASILLALFGTNMLEIGSASVALKAMRGESYGIKDIFSAFKKGEYLRNVGAMALYTLFVALAVFVCFIPIEVFIFIFAVLFATKMAVWLFVIIYVLVSFIAIVGSCVPAFIIKYGLSRVPYLLADDKEIKPMAAIKKSWKMMTGHKGEFFMLRLSFLGWNLLNFITFGITGIFWSNPYMNLTLAGYHDELVSGYEGAEVVPEVIE